MIEKKYVSSLGQFQGIGDTPEEAEYKMLKNGGATVLSREIFEEIVEKSSSDIDWCVVVTFGFEWNVGLTYEVAEHHSSYPMEINNPAYFYTEYGDDFDFPECYKSFEEAMNDGYYDNNLVEIEDAILNYMASIS